MADWRWGALDAICSRKGTACTQSTSFRDDRTAMAATHAKLILIAIIVHACFSLGGAFSAVFAAFSGGDALYGWAQGFSDLKRGLSVSSTRYYTICLIVAVLSVPLTLGVTNAWLLARERRYRWLAMLAVSFLVAMISLAFYLIAAFLPLPGSARLGVYVDIAVRWVAPFTLAAWLALVPISSLVAHAFLSVLVGATRAAP